MAISGLEQSHHELQRLVDLSEEILSTENCVTRELRQLLQLSTSSFGGGNSNIIWRKNIANLLSLCSAIYPGVENSFIQHSFLDVDKVRLRCTVLDLPLWLVLKKTLHEIYQLQSDIRTRDFDLLLRLSQQKLKILQRRRKAEEKQVTRRLAPSTSLPSMNFHSALEQAGLNGPELGPSSVYDVVHVMRKGRQSLLRQQADDAKIRNGSTRNAQPARSLEHCASDLVYRVSPYEAKAVQTTKCRAGRK